MNFAGAGSVTQNSGSTLTLGNSGGASGTLIQSGTGNIILSGGNVGIGTTAPGSLLHTYGSDATIREESTAENKGLLLVKSGVQGFGLTVNGASQRLDISSANSWPTITPVMSIMAAGNVGIGTTSPRATLDVYNGAVIGAPAVSNGTSSIDFSKGNIQYTASSCGAFTLNYLVDGGTYNFVIKGTTSATCSFTAYSGNGTGALTVHMPPGHGATTASTMTLYSFMVVGTDLFVSWVPGY